MKSHRHPGRWALVAAILAATVVMATHAEAKPPTEGMLQALDKEGTPVGLCPLEHTDVQADIAGFIARVTLTQRFGNPYETPIEAVYTFPMSDRAAVDRMTMKIGDRTIKGLIKEREEARRIYEAARNAGQAASLLDQERPNIFTQSVANILPGDTITITISYVEYLVYKDGEYTFSFPMVVGPRYIPGNPATPPADIVRPDVQTGRKPGPASTDQVPDSGRITPPITPKGTRAGHDISLAVKLNAGVPLQGLDSVLHKVNIKRPGEAQAVVKLRNERTIPNRDFVLKYAVAGGDIEDAILTHKEGKGGYFTFIMQPPERVQPKEVTPKELVFVIDSSGSMGGFPIEKAKKAMRMSIEGMNPDDTFNLMTFAGGTKLCFRAPVANTAKNRRTALKFLEDLQGRGGTEMMKAIRGALADQNDPERLRIVCFMTDGFIGNDMAILEAIQENRQTARVFSFGIGNSVNRYLIEGMARAGRGEAEIVTLESKGEEAAARFHERISSPLLTDITIDFGGLHVEDVYPDPGAPPDLFAAQPLVLKGRYSRGGKGIITVRGTTADGPFEREIEVELPKREAGNDVLAPIWARERIEWLMNQDLEAIQRRTPDETIKKAIIDLGLEYNLVTQFTSFVAVEQRVITEGGKPKTVEVPVEMPDGVSYEGIFGDEHAQMSLGFAYSTGSKVMASPMRRVPAERIMPQVAPKMPAPRPASAAGAAQDSEPKKESTKGHAKIDKALWNLKAKLVDGNYARGAVKVKGGWVDVFVVLNDLTDANLKAVKNLGVKVVSQLRSSDTLLARVRVEDLEKVANLACVKRIAPPKY